MTLRTACLLLVMSVPSCRRPSDVCQTNVQCPEGMKCFETVCAPACLEMTCLDGHFCDPDTNECVTECPFVCNPPDHSTPKCEVACGYTCQAGFYADSGACPVCSVAEHCGPTCAPCASGEFCNGGTTCSPIPHFTRDTTTSTQPTVKDNVTALIWQGCTVGLTGDQCGSGAGMPMTWVQAGPYCTALSWATLSGWRLPNIDELSSLGMGTSPSLDIPTIDTAAFPATSTTDRYWSSSSITGDPMAAQVYSFRLGSGRFNLAQAEQALVRCVRNQ
jgi:hypothetical protein